MRDREQRLRWIEKLIGGAQQDVNRSNALVIPTAKGHLAIPFPSVEEVVTGEKVQPLAFLPAEFCGVLNHGNELAPVIDVGGKGEGAGGIGRVVLVRGKDCLLGLKFFGAPNVVDLNEVEHAPVVLLTERRGEGEGLRVLDADAAIDALLALD